MSRGKYAFWCPVALIRPSRSACSSSQIRYPYGLITMLPRTGPRSTSSARKTTSLYQAEKSSLCGVTLRSSRATPFRLPSRVLPPNRISSPLTGLEAGESDGKPPESAQLRDHRIAVGTSRPLLSSLPVLHQALRHRHGQDRGSGHAATAT